MQRRIPCWLALSSLAVIHFSLSPACHAESKIAGSYHCSHAQVEGKKTKCSSPPLILNDDGSYQLMGKEGHYSVQGKWLYLRHFKNERKGKLQPGHRITFHYRDRGKLCEIVFERHRMDLGSASLS